MSKLKTLSNRFMVFIILVLGFTRTAMGRVFPFLQPSAKAPSAKVFTLSQGEWLELRAMSDVGTAQSGNQQAQAEEKKVPPAESKDTTKREEDKSAPASDCKQEGAKAGEDKKSAPDADAKNADGKKAEKNCDPGPGGGDGDMGGTGG